MCSYSNWIKIIVDFSAHVTLKLDGWPQKIIGQIFFITSSFVHHLKPPCWIQTGVIVWKCSIRSKSAIFLSRVTLKFDGRPWKTIGHIFCATLSFVHHFKAINEFKLELQSGNAQLRSKSVIFLAGVTFKFDGWPWKTIGHLFYVA